MNKRNVFIGCLAGIVGVVWTGAAHAVVSLDLGEIVIKPSRIAQHGYKIASNVSVIGQKEIQASNASNVSEILASEMGVHIYDNGTPKTRVVDIRGFGDTANRNVLVLVNDRKINSIDNSGPDLLQIPIESVDRIEIIRGAGSVLYGDNAVGGVINIITKQGKGDFSGRLGAVGGSYKTSGLDLEVSGSKFFNFLDQGNDVSYYLYSKYYDDGGYRKNSDVLARDYVSRFGYKLSDKLSVDLEMDWHEDEYGLPGGLNATELATLGRKGSADPKDFAETRDRSFQLGFDYKPWPDNVDWGRFVLDLSYRNRDTFARFGAFDFNTKRGIDAFGINTKYIFDHTIFNKEFNFVAGIDYYNTDNDIIGSGSNSDLLTITKEEAGYYLYSEYEMLDDIFFNAGTRYQQAEYTFDQKQTTRSYTTQSPDQSVNSVGMKYEYAPGSNVFWGVQQTFRFLSTDEWYNAFSGELSTDLKQQRGIQYEAGWQHNHRDQTVFSVTPYLMYLKDEIFLNPDSGFFGSNDNYDKTRRVGVEVGQKTDLLKFVDLPLDRLQFSTNYTFQDPEFLEGPNDGKQIPMAPQNQAGFGIQTGFLKHVTWAFNGRYVGSQFAINDTSNITPTVKPYFVADSKITYKLKDVEVFFALNNIFNEKYFSYISKATTSLAQDFYPAPDRHWRAGFNFRF